MVFRSDVSLDDTLFSCMYVPEHGVMPRVRGCVGVNVTEIRARQTDRRRTLRTASPRVRVFRHTADTDNDHTHATTRIACVGWVRAQCQLWRRIQGSHGGNPVLLAGDSRSDGIGKD
jgi:hypothetical protein|eukprot:231602-Prymnesium_polylepis.1